MYRENTWKSLLYGLFLALLFLLALGLNVLEFLHYFIARGENTLFAQPVEVAARAEFFVMLLFSLPSALINLHLLSKIRRPMIPSYVLCILFVSIQAVKLLFYIPNLMFSQIPIWYLLKQFPPIAFSLLVGIAAFMKISDLKFNKYV